MSISIEFKNIVKKYGDNTVIPDLSLTIEKGELFTLLGPSGCGKTTLLRMVAGFNSIEGGEIRFNDEIINNKPPKDRNIGMVFQSYAIFPHLSVRENVAFGLENRKLPKSEIKNKVDKILKIVQMEEYADRLPENLSGGQQQRVALARAIVVEPNVLLMDEPLSNLDAKLRVDLRSAIKDIQESIGITTVYVTHDQEEAMAISDRIAVMRKGVIEHLGTGQNIYHRPANIFVASFIGRTNFIETKILEENGKNFLEFEGGYRLEIDNLIDTIENNRDVVISARPEEIIILDDKTSPGIRGQVIRSIFLGLNIHYFIELETGQVIEVIGESSLDSLLDPGSRVNLNFKREKINIFDRETEKNLTKGVVNDG